MQLDNPLLLIFAGVVLFIITPYLIFSDKGIFNKYRKSKKLQDKEFIENALKFVYDCEYRGAACTINSLAGNLRITTDHCVIIVTELLRLNLIYKIDDRIVLTPEGRTYALRIIRIHRLWEKYLADKTGINEKEWHYQAEIQEHILSENEADELSAILGNPLYDPHGDPIPLRDGEIPPKKGIPLTRLVDGDFAEIVHIEDEPDTIYAQLTALDLHPGMKLRIIDSNTQKIVFECEGDEKILSPIFCANISVVKIEHAQLQVKEYVPLSTLEEGELAKISGISKSIRGLQRRRLLDLGFVHGSEIIKEFSSPNGDPVAFRIKNSLIALRKEQSDKIFIERV